MTNALLTSGESLSLGGTLIGYKEDAGDETLLRPITGTSDITIYSVLEVVGGNSVYSPYMLLTPHTYGTHAFTLDTGNAGETFMRSRVDTSLQVNWVVQSTPGYYVAGNTVICW